MCQESLIVFKSIFDPILIYVHEFWVMTERARSQTQTSEIRFLQKFRGRTVFNKVCNTSNRKRLNIALLHFTGSKDLSLDDLAMKAECLRNDFPSKLYMQKFYLLRFYRVSWSESCGIFFKQNAICVIGPKSVAALTRAAVFATLKENGVKKKTKEFMCHVRITFVLLQQKCNKIFWLLQNNENSQHRTFPTKKRSS